MPTATSARNARVVSAATFLTALADRYAEVDAVFTISSPTPEQPGWTFETERADGTTSRCTAPTLGDLLNNAWYYDLSA